MSEEEGIVLEENLEPEPAMTEVEREIAIEKRMAEAKEARMRPGVSKRKTKPIKKNPPNTPAEAYNIEVNRKPMNQPWRPASILTSRKKGMRFRWVRKDLLEKRIEEGWMPRISSTRSRVDAPEQTLVDGRPLSSYVIKRNLVLCDMPEEMASSREAYYKKISDSGLKAQKEEFKNQTAVGGSSYSYGEVKVEK